MNLLSIKKRILGADNRTILLRKNIFANFLIKGISGIIMLLLVPLTLKCLGVYANGVWQTISAALILIDNLDIGLGNGLRNKLTEFVAKGDWNNARRAVSTTQFLLIGIILPFMIFLIVLVNSVDLYTLLNVDSTAIKYLPLTISICIALFCSTFILKFLGNIYLGLQLPAISNFLAMSGQPIILLLTYIAYKNNLHSLLDIATINLASPLLIYILAYPYTFYKRYPQLRPSFKFFSKAMTNCLFTMGVLFFLNQISSTIVLISSNMIVSRWFSPAMVTPYQIAYKYFSIPLIVFMVINAPIWSATTDAYQRNDIEWIKNSNHRMNKTLLSFGGIILAMIACSKYIYSIWIGSDIYIDIKLTISVGIYIYMMMLSLVYCYYLNGIGALKLQLFCTLIGVAVYLLFSFIFFKLSGNILSITISMGLSLIPNVICNKIQFTKIINKTAKGIWTK